MRPHKPPKRLPALYTRTLPPISTPCPRYSRKSQFLGHYTFSTSPCSCTLRILHLVVALDDIGIGRWRSFRLAAATLATLVVSRCLGRRLCRSLRALLRLRFVGDDALLSRSCAVVHGGSAWSRGRTGVRHNIVGGAALGALAIVRALISIVWVGILQDNVPCVKKSRKDTEAAECDVDE